MGLFVGENDHFMALQYLFKLGSEYVFSLVWGCIP